MGGGDGAEPGLSGRLAGGTRTGGLRQLVPDQGEDQLGAFAQGRLGHLVLERAAAVGGAVALEVRGEPGVLLQRGAQRGEGRGTGTVAEGLRRGGGQLGQGQGRAGALGGQASQQFEGLALLPAQRVGDVEAEPAQCDGHRAQQAEVDLGALAVQRQDLPQVGGQLGVGERGRVRLAEGRDALREAGRTVSCHSSITRAARSPRVASTQVAMRAGTSSGDSGTVPM